MNRPFSLLIVLSFGGFLLGATRVGADPPWKIGEMWDLQVEGPGKSTYIVHALIGGVETVDGAACWQVIFVPGNGAPAHLKEKRQRVSVNQKTGQPVRALKVADKQPIAVETAGTIRFITGLPEGMPLEWFSLADPPVGKSPISGTTRSVAMRKQEMGDHFVLEQTLFDNDVEQWSIRQQWVPGEKWWRSYERSVQGRTDLVARQLNPATMIGKKPGPDLPAKLPTSEPPKQAKDESTAQKSVAAAKPTTIGEAPPQTPTTPPPALKPWQTTALAAIGVLLAATLGLLGFYYWRNRKAA